MNVTIKDVALAAGVSYSTVSKALNNSPLVKERTKKKIIQIAEEMGYEPNFAAQKLVSKQTKIIGLIWPTIERAFLSTLVTKISDEISQTKYSMILSVEPVAASVNTFKKFQVDGIILFEDHTGQQVDFPSIPLLSYGAAGQRSLPYPVIDPNHEAAMEKSIHYLAELNHNHIAYIGDLSTSDPMQQEKYRGFEKAMTRYQLPVHDKNRIDTGGLNWFDGYAAANSLLSGPDDMPTAIIGGSYDISGGIIRAVREKGLDVPGDISLISYDNIPQMANMEIPVTAVGVPIDQIAKEIVQNMIHLVEGQGMSDSIVKLDPDLNKRMSCAPASS